MEDWVQNQYLVFLVEMQESRNFDVLFEVFLGVFLVFGREKKRRESLGRREISEKCLWGVWGMLGAIYSLRCENRGGSHYRVANLNPPLIGMILTPLDRSWFLVSKKVWN